jgi:glycine oxidase
MEIATSTDIAIAGGGLIGLSLALELNRRGASVVLLDAAEAGKGASSAAAGMLAVNDPHNPPQLRELARWSMSLYDEFLERLARDSGVRVPYQTNVAWQYMDARPPLRLAEWSVDPRQLVAAALGSVRRRSIALLEGCGSMNITRAPGGVSIEPQRGQQITAGRLVHASGAWFGGAPRIGPRKGQMLRVRMPSGFTPEVHRSGSIYVVPRTEGAQAASAVIGATEEDAGFDTSTSQPALDDLRARAAAEFTALPWLADAPQLESWAGLRPATEDRLPLLGPLPGREHEWIAGGHFRNGILLAPSTAVAMADLLEGKATTVDLRAFAPDRVIKPISIR